MQNNTTIIVSVLVLVVIALGVWWYVNTHPAPASTTEVQNSAPVSGQLQGTVR